MQDLMDRTWIVIPLYNEASVIGTVVQDCLSVFSHVVCVDDGSHDESGTTALAAGAIVVNHPINLGQGAALQTGIEFCLEQDDCDYIVTFDADGQHLVTDARAMVERAEQEDLAIVFGTRFHQGPVEVGIAKRIILKTAAKITEWRTKMHLTDAHNGLRVLRRDAATVIKLRQNRMAHASEIVAQLAHSHLPYAEHPVHIRYTTYSKSKGQSLLNSINILVDLVIK